MRIKLYPRIAWDYASYNGYLGKVKILVVRGADAKTNNGGFTPLHFASRDGRIEMVEIIIFVSFFYAKKIIFL